MLPLPSRVFGAGALSREVEAGHGDALQFRLWAEVMLAEFRQVDPRAGQVEFIAERGIEVDACLARDVAAKDWASEAQYQPIGSRLLDLIFDLQLRNGWPSSVASSSRTLPLSPMIFEPLQRPTAATVPVTLVHSSPGHEFGVLQPALPVPPNIRRAARFGSLGHDQARFHIQRVRSV